MVEAGALKAIKENEKEIVALNQLQLLEGVDSFGDLLEPPYKSAAYAEKKLTLNPLGVVDLKLTGDFHAGFFVAVSDRFPFYIFSKDEKTRRLVGMYGINIFGLTDENKSDIAKLYVLPEVKGLLLTAIHV